MSEQFAMQPDEFDSTNSALDSILDRLNSLGESAASMKAAPLRPLQSVPQLDPTGPVPVSAAEPVIEAPNLGLVPPVAAALVQAPTVETPTAPSAPEVVVQSPVAPSPVTPSPVAPSPVVALSTLPEVPALPETPSLIERAPAPSYLVAEAPSDVVPPVAVDPAPMSVEHHELELPASEQIDETPAAPVSVFEQHVDQSQAMETAAVFELDAETLEAEASLETDVLDLPEAPTSIFSPELSAPVDDQTSAPETDGWVSYHEDELAVVTTAPDVPVDAVLPGLFDEHADTFAEDMAVENEANATVPDAAEAVVESLAPQESLDDFFAGLETSDEESVAVLESDSMFDMGVLDTEVLDAEMLNTEITTVDDIPAGDALEIDEFPTDEDLPLPDFTGVYNGTVTEGGFWGDSDNDVPESVDAGLGQISAQRDEFDKLRPTDEEMPEALEKESVDLSIKLQMIGVIIVGILALLAVWLKDPGVVADMRASVESLFG